MKKFLLIACAIALSVISCSKKKIPENPDLLGLKYYPTTLGKYVIYDVDSTIYTDLPKDTISYKYRIKEKMADTYTDNQGLPALRLERYIKKYNPLKPYDSIAWTMKEVWMVNTSQKNVQVVEGNVRYTKLIFPVQEKTNWDGNANNTIGEWLYTYDYIDKAETINNNSLDNVLSVKQKDYRTVISYQYFVEKYAKGAGLVYREMKDLVSDKNVTNKPVEDRIEYGMIYKQTLVTYGYE